MSNRAFSLFILSTFAIFLFVIVISSAPFFSWTLQQSSGESEVQNYAFIRKWGSNGTGPGHFDRPHDVDFDSKGNVYVSDRELDNIQKFTHNGTFIKMWGSRGSGDGQFKVPYSIGIDPKDEIYVVDRENHRIQKFDSNGTFLAKGDNRRGNSDNQ